MNRLEMAQYINDEFIHHNSKVINVEMGRPLQAFIIYEDGTKQECSGKPAVDLRLADGDKMDWVEQ